MTGELIEQDGSQVAAGELVPETSGAPAVAGDWQPVAGDWQLLELWLHGRPATTAEVYRRDTRRLSAHLGKPLRSATLADLQAYAGTLGALAPASQVRMLASVKSLFGFAHRVGYLPFDVARPLRLPPLKNRLAERIIEEAEARRLIALEPNPRNHVLLRLLYGCGLRVSEVCALCWRDMKGTWQVNVTALTIEAFAFGEGRFGDPFRSWGSRVLECVLGRIKPAQTYLVFSYSGAGGTAGLDGFALDVDALA